MIAPPKLPSGDSRLSHWLKQLAQFAIENSLAPGVGYRLEKTSRGTILFLDGNGGAAATAPQRFVVFTEEEDHLVCGLLNDDDVWSTEETLVAKEIPLREAPSVDHEIRPPFDEQDPEGETLTGTIIYAVIPQGGTGLEDIEWLMLDDTRDWAYPLEFRDPADSCVLKRLWVKTSDDVEVV